MTVMTPEQIEAVEATMAVLAPALDDLAADVYARLDRLAPETAELFTGDPAAQRQKFAAELETIVRAIRHHDAFLERASRLGRQHVHYGVRPVHYELVGAALFEALAAALGATWTEATAEAWRLAYRLTAEAMMQAGEAEGAASVSV